METINKVLVGLDLTNFDDNVLDYAAFFCSSVGAKEVYFLHVEEKFLLPEDYPERLKDSFMPMDESEKLVMKENIDKYFLGSQYDIKVEVLEGDIEHTIAHYIDTKGIDLAIIGNKDPENALKIMPYKILRRSKASVLFVPPSAVKKLNTIALPFDFSDHSKSALEFSNNLSANCPELKVNLFHVYDVPVGYYRTGKNFEEMSEIIQDFKAKKFEGMIKDYPNLDYSIAYRHHEDRGVAAEILDFFKNDDFDMILMGSKGQSNSAAVLLGSKAERLVQVKHNKPMLIIKKKGENKNLLQAFFDAL